jgi:hypothetical protein
MALIERFARHDAIVISDEGDAILARRGPAGCWMLPRVTSDSAHPADVRPLLTGLRAQLGGDASVLRCVRSEPLPASDVTYRWHEVELHPIGRSTPAGWQWLRSREVSDRRSADSATPELGERCLAAR